MGRNFNNEKSSSTNLKKATQLASFEKEIKTPEHIKIEYERKKVTSSIKKVKTPSHKKTLAKSVPARPFPQKEIRIKREKTTKATKRKKSQNKTTNKKKKVNSTTKKKPVSARKMRALATYYNRMIRRYTIISLVFLLVSACGFVFFATQFQKATVIGKSMEPTLYPNDKVLYQKRTKLKRFDLVVFPPTKESKELYVKRIVGMPGESVRYKDDVLYVDDLDIEEPYLEGILSTFDTTTSQNYTKDFSLTEIPNVNQESNTIPEGYYLLLGDNRNNSTDSRTIGLISKDLIQGVVRFRYSPLSRLGIL